jgi:hypothetical protein
MYVGNLNDSRETFVGLGKTYKGNIKTSAKESLVLYEMKPHKSWFDEECSRFLDQRKQAKIQWLQNPNHSHVNNLNNVRREASRHFRGEKRRNV